MWLYSLLLIGIVQAPPPPVPDPPLNEEPIIPIPTGHAGDSGFFFSFFHSSRGGVKREVYYQDDDGSRDYLRASKRGEWKPEFIFQNENRRLVRYKKTGPIPQFMWLFDQFFDDRLVLSCELDPCLTAPKLGMFFCYYPIEGVMFAVGFDLLRLELHYGLQLFLF